MLRQWSIGHRLMLMVLMVVAVLGLLLFACLRVYYQGLMAEKSNQARSQVETAYSLVASYEEQVRQGRLDEQKRQGTGADRRTKTALWPERLFLDQ